MDSLTILASLDIGKSIFLAGLRKKVWIFFTLKTALTLPIRKTKKATKTFQFF